MSLVDYARTFALGRLHFVNADERGGYSAPRVKETTAASWKPVAAVVGAALFMLIVAAHQPSTPPATELAMLQHAADDGDAGAQIQLGLAHREGRLGLDADRPLGDYWIHRAAQGGNRYARTLESGPGAEHPSAWLAALRSANPGEQSADRLLEKARTGDTVAQYQLAMRYRDGAFGVKADPEQAHIWLERAAQAGNTVAMTTLADAYLHGQLGLSPDPDAARAWRARAQSTD